MTKAIDPILALKRELAALTKKVATLEKQLADSKSATDVTCTLLTVVDSQGKTVASIDGTGLVECRNALIAPNRKTRGVYLDGKAGRVRCLAFSKVGSTGNTVLVEIGGESSPWIILRGDKDNAGVRLQARKGQGGVIDVTDNSGGGGGGGGVLVTATKRFSNVRVKQPGVVRGGVTLSASYREHGGGIVYTEDRNGAVTGRMPLRVDGKVSKVLKVNETLKTSGRKPAK